MPDITIHEAGNGPSILLIHGFPMNSQVWEDFRIPLSKHFTVLSIDLPGFGTSDSLEIPFSIADVAAMILEKLTKKGISNCIVVGHSLGGYVALAMANQMPKFFSGLVLFHSTAFPDPEERKISRLKVIEFIERNGVLAFTSNFILPLFSNQDHPAIKKVRAIAIQSPEAVVKGFTLAMRNRPSSIETLQKLNTPILFLAGRKDGGITIESILEQASMCQHPEIQVLEDVAHMGMFENSELTSKLIIQFAKNCFH